MSYYIKRVVPGDDDSPETLADVEIFTEQPAPAGTLGGRLLALENETGFRHVAIDGAPEPALAKGRV